MLSILFLLLLSLAFPIFCTTPLPLPVEDSNCHEGCFPQPVEFCPSNHTICRCTVIPNCEKVAICCNVNEFSLIEGSGCGSKYDFPIYNVLPKRLLLQICEII